MKIPVRVHVTNEMTVTTTAYDHMSNMCIYLSFYLSIFLSFNPSIYPFMHQIYPLTLSSLLALNLLDLLEYNVFQMQNVVLRAEIIYQSLYVVTDTHTDGYGIRRDLCFILFLNVTIQKRKQNEKNATHR